MTDEEYDRRRKAKVQEIAEFLKNKATPEQLTAAADALLHYEEEYGCEEIFGTVDVCGPINPVFTL